MKFLCKSMVISIFILILIGFVPEIVANSDLGWEQINEDGYGNSNNIAPRGIEIFNDYLVIGTTNINKSIMTWELRTFINILKHDLGGDKIKSDGCEIWCYDGVDWKQVIGNNEEAIMASGFGNKNNWDCSFLIEFKGFLYAGLWNTEDGSQIWRTDDLTKEWELVAETGLGNTDNLGFWSAEEFNDYLYVGTMNFKQGCEIFRSSDGENWEVVVGEAAKTKSGFGTNSNFYAWSMCVYDSYLYIGTDNSGG